MKSKVKKHLSTSVKMLLGSVAVANSIVVEPNRFAGVDFKGVLSASGNLSGQSLDRGLLVSTPVHPDTGYDLTLQEDRDEVDYEMKRDDPFLSVARTWTRPVLRVNTLRIPSLHSDFDVAL